MFYFIKKIKSLVVANLTKLKYQCWLYSLFRKHQKDCLGLEFCSYKKEYRKFRRLLLKYGSDDNLRLEIKFFYKSDLKQHGVLDFDKDCQEPILIVVVKNELERMKLFYSHYQKLGVKYFVVIDNDSTDGTREWICRQANTAVFLVREEYSSIKRVAWIQRVLAVFGYNRWYAVVDSDELLDFVGSESHCLQDCINYAKRNNFVRLSGMMVDMYSEKKIFSEEGSCENIEKILCYFDTDSYVKKTRFINPFYKGVYFTGGPRGRVLHSETQLAKQCLFYYSEDDLYYDSHFLFPIIEWKKESSCFAIRHYKFLKEDVEEYWRRSQKGGFAFKSRYYKDMFDANGLPIALNFMYEGSARYINSESLKQLPYLTSLWDL